MIRYALTCGQSHDFESWFQNADAFDKLAAAGALSCPVCNDGRVKKAIMAPQVATSDRREEARPLDDARAAQREAAARIAAFRAYVESRTEDVGDQFAEQARKIHYGEVENRLIRGEATLDEAKALLEEGVPVAPLPWGRKTD